MQSAIKLADTTSINTLADCNRKSQGWQQH
jgi:hypothetical protein